MEEGEEDDPFGSIAELCLVSPSQESLLRRRSFLCQDRPPASSSSSEKNGNYQNLAFIQAESARIAVVSASESMEEENSHKDGSRSSDEREDHPTVEEGCFRDADTVLVDSGSMDRFPVVVSARDADLEFLLENLKTMQVIEVDLGENAAFQSEDKVSMSISSPVSQPLEGCFSDAGTVPVNSDSMDRFPVVDSARDADLGLLQQNLKSKVIEVHLEQNAAFQSEPDEARVSTRGSSPIEQPLEESPSKRLKITGVESPDSLPEPREEIPNFFEKLNSRIVSSSPGNASAPTIKLVNPPANPQSNDEAGEDTLTGREALMKSFEKLKSEIVSGDIEPERKRCEMEKKAEEEKKADGKRVLPPSFNATTAAAASKTNVLNEPAAFSAPSSVNVTQGIAQNVMDSAVPIENEDNQAEISLADVLKALGKDDPYNQNLRHLSIMDIMRGRTMILTPSWWPKEGLEVKR